MPTRTHSDAVRRTLNFLLAMRRPDGLWYDFHTLAGLSNDWVSAVVLNALAAADSARVADEANRSIAALLRRQRRNGGWSYNEGVPTDCDSTAWAVLAVLTRTQWRPSALVRAARYVLQHQDIATGAFATYAPFDRIHRYIETTPGQTADWLGPHLGVSCLAVQALFALGVTPDAPRMAAALRYIAGVRSPQGLWSCYWWRGHGYATYHALRALVIGQALPSELACEVAAAIIDGQAADGTWHLDDGGASAFETAHMLRALKLLKPGVEGLSSQVQRAEGALLELQKRDGSFEPMPILRIPQPLAGQANAATHWRIDEPGTGVVVSDCERVFTAACALMAWA